MEGRKYTWRDFNKKMSPPVEVQYRDLLCPIKDAAKSFEVNIALLLQSYVQNFREGSVPANFNSAALLLQGSSSIYGKKVEYLHNLASTLHDCLARNKRDDHRKKDPKEKTPKQSKLVDPFCSTEIKPGKKLSCLRRKITPKAAAASRKSKKPGEKQFTFTPVDLLPLECEEKGDVFYDTRGEAVGNKGDYALNKCRITTSGWLLLPTVSADLVSDLSSSGYYPAEIIETDNHCNSDVDMEGTPGDEGYPPSSGCPSSPPTAPSSQVPLSQQSDEGLGSLMSTPSDGPSSQPEGGSSSVQPNAESPMEGVESAAVPTTKSTENSSMEVLPGVDDVSARPVRRSIRQALSMRQIDPQEEETAASNKDEVVAVKKAIQKNNTCCLPKKLRKVNNENIPLHPASVFCARTFFSLDSKLQKSDLLSLNVTAFANNSKFINQIKKYKDAIRAAKCKRKANGEIIINEDDEIEVEGMEVVKEVEADPDGVPPNPSFEDDDFVVDNEPLIEMEGENPVADEIPIGDVAEVGGADMPAVEGAGRPMDLDNDFLRMAEEQMSLFRDDLQNFEQNSEMSHRVREWQKKLKPFLKEIEKRETFDINLYGSRILNAFEDTNRRQSIIFREFCKDKQKWEIHRYFMALLPLANIGNVTIGNQARDDGEEDDIVITLLSRKMHHLELEEFGHSMGEHS